MLKFSLTKSVRKPYQPKKDLVKKIIQKSLLKRYRYISLSICIVGIEESNRINLHYRNIDKPTNVIALEYPDTREQFAHLTGEIILCDNIIVAEANLQNKTIIDHYIHMLVHAVLHLQGLDHIIKSESAHMEAHEIQILQEFNIKNPYI